MMKSKTKIFIMLMLILSAVVCFAVGCSGKEIPADERYDYVFNKPFAATPDSGMTIDGKLDEEVWANKSWLSHSVRNMPWQVTTHFTEKGIYVALKVTDDNMFFITRFTSRSAFRLYLCKTGTETYGINNLIYHEARCFVFELDPYYCRSMNRVPYCYKANVEGELNSNTTCTMTAELFLSWKDLYYTVDELGENGYPEDIQMYVNYCGEATEVLGTCLWREETYLHFDKDGFMGIPADENLGSVPGGVAATDMWVKNERGNFQTTAGRTQILWAKNAYAKDFIFEARLKPLSTNDNGEQIYLRGEKVWGRFGLINESANAVYNIYSADARSVTDYGADSRSVKVQTCRQIDSFHWQNRIGLYQQTVQTGYDQDAVTLRVIKQGDMFYYFYGENYWNSERIADMSDAVYCGIFTSQGVEVESHKFEDYTGRSADLIGKLSEYMYFVETSSVGPGTATASLNAVAKGAPVTVSLTPNSGGVMTGLTLNGRDVYDSVTNAMNSDCEYTFVPESDTVFEAKFSAFSSDALVRTVIMFEDKQHNQVKEGDYKISCENNKLLHYKGSPNASGYVVLDLPKEGSYTVDGKTFNVSGEYSLGVKFSSYHDCIDSFVLKDGITSIDIRGKAESVSGTKSFTKKVTVAENDWGTVIVNGIGVVGGGSLNYNAETTNYYVENASVIRYFKNTVAEDWAADFKLDFSEIGHANNDVAGIAITNGRYLVVIKANIESKGKLIIATGVGTDSTTSELAINGFGYDKAVAPSDGENNGECSVSFKVVKSGSAIYLFDKSGVLRAYLNENGLNTVSCSISWGAGVLGTVNAHIKGMLADGNETAIGYRTHLWKSMRVEYTMNFTTDAAAVYTDAISYGKIKVNADGDITLSSDFILKEGYGLGETVKFGIKLKNAEKVNARLVVTDGLGTYIVEGKYDYYSKAIVFSFISRGGSASAYINIPSEGKIEWSDEWGGFTPDRENTYVELDN